MKFDTAELAELQEAFQKGTLHNVINLLEPLTSRSQSNSAHTTRICILRNHTIDNLVWFLRAGAVLRNLAVECTLAPFDQLVPFILDPNSTLHRENTDVVILSLILEPFTNHDVNFTVPEVMERISEIIQALRDNTTALLVLNTFLIPTMPTQGITTARNPASLEQKNQTIKRLASYTMPRQFSHFHSGLQPDRSTARHHARARLTTVVQS